MTTKSGSLPEDTLKVQSVKSTQEKNKGQKKKLMLSGKVHGGLKRADPGRKPIESGRNQRQQDGGGAKKR